MRPINSAVRNPSRVSDPFARLQGLVAAVSRFIAACCACGVLCAVNTAAAHHSFAVFFDTDSKLVKVTGVVREFRFSNPHGVVALDVRQGGKTVVWRAETNSPSILRRRGWNQQSIHVGETITIEGWPARY